MLFAICLSIRNSLKYATSIGTASHYCEAVVLESRAVPFGTALVWCKQLGSRVQGPGLKRNYRGHVAFAAEIEVRNCEAHLADSRVCNLLFWAEGSGLRVHLKTVNRATVCRSEAERPTPSHDTQS